MEPRIIELIDSINGPLRSALAVVDLLTCSERASLLEHTLPDVATLLCRSIQEAKSSVEALHSLLREALKDTNS